jgi:DNA polymerase-3 subunit beta
MTFDTFTQNILGAIGTAERSCGKSLQLPIINCVLLSIEKNKLKVSATNLEQGITIEMLGKSEGSGKIAVPAKMVLELLRSIKSEKTTIFAQESSLKIEADGRRALIQGFSGDEFPVIPKIEPQEIFEIPAVIFGRALEAVAVAASRSDIRVELAGVYFEWNPKTDDSKLTIASTDSFRLAEYNFKSKDIIVKNKEQTGSCILPLRAVQEIIRISGETEGNLAFAISETQFGIRWGNGEFVSRLLEGSFPNYRAIIPQTFKTEVSCPRRIFTDLIRQAGLFSSKINDVKLKIDSKQKEVTVSSKDAAKGEYEGKLECAVSGEDAELTFNYQFLVDGLERIETDEIMLGLNDPNSPALTQPLGGEAAYRYVAMPLRV